MSHAPGLEPFRIDVPDSVLADLRRRLEAARWPEPETVDDWSQGAPSSALRALCNYWREDYDWRRVETRLNAYEQFLTEVDGLPLHLFHIRSSRPDALPLILANGWPSSAVEFLDVIGPLTDPATHGYPSAPAFHLIIPTHPGFGFSGKPQKAGWTVERIAGAWVELTKRLGYGRVFVHGGDWGATIATALAMAHPEFCMALHLTMPLIFPDADDMKDLTAAERASVETLQFFENSDSGYAKLQATRPQTLSYGLTDSPIGQAAWIYEKMQAWTDHDGSVEDLLGRDAILDNITLYWVTATAGSSARLYWESLSHFKPGRIDAPVGVSVFPKETIRPSRRWAERGYAQIIHWNELDRGGHFPAIEQPQTFVAEVRACFLKAKVWAASYE